MKKKGKNPNRKCSVIHSHFVLNDCIYVENGWIIKQNEHFASQTELCNGIGHCFGGAVSSLHSDSNDKIQ